MCMLPPVQKLYVTSCAEVVCYIVCRSCMLHPVQKLDVTSCAVVCCILCRSCNLHPVQDLSVTSMRLSRTTELSVAVIGHLVFCSRQQRVLSQDQALRQVVVNFSILDSGLLLLPFWAQYVIGCILLSSSMHVNDLWECPLVPEVCSFWHHLKEWSTEIACSQPFFLCVMHWKKWQCACSFLNNDNNGDFWSTNPTAQSTEQT